MEPVFATRHQPRALKRGVTVVELLVVLMIIGILMVVVMTSHATFNKTIILSYTAYDVALSIRAAENYGIGSRTGTLYSSTVTNRGYGTHFTPNSGSFSLFADKEQPPTGCHPLRSDAMGDFTIPDAIYGNCAYTSGTDSIITTYGLGNGMTITPAGAQTSGPLTNSSRGLCVSADNGANWDCSIKALDIVFARPNTNALFGTDTGAGSQWRSAVTRAVIILTSPQGGFSYVCIQATGQIYVNNNTTSPCA